MTNTVQQSTSDDVAAAFAASDAGAPPPQRATEIIEPVFGSTPAPATRDEHGRFRPSSDATASPPAAPAGGVAAPVATPPAGGPPAPPVAPVAAPAGGAAAAAGGGVSLDPSKPPQGWRPEAKDKWATIPEDLRQEIVRREEASAAGVARMKQQMEPAERVYSVIAKNQEYFEHINTDPQVYVESMIRVEQTLALGNPAQRMEAIIKLAEDYGVPLRQVIDSAMGGKLNAVLQQSHQHHRTPATIPPEVAQELDALRNVQRTMVEKQAADEYHAFASDTSKRPFLEEVSEGMAELLERGLCTTYEEAYDMAVWRDPVLRQKSVAIMNGDAQTNALRQRQQNAGMVRTPAVAPMVSGGGSENAPETTEDAVRRAFQQYNKS